MVMTAPSLLSSSKPFIKGLSYIELPVAAALVPATTAFYVDLLGFDVVQKPEGDDNNNDSNSRESSASSASLACAAEASLSSSGVWLQNFDAGLCLHIAAVSATVSASPCASLTFVSNALENVMIKLNETKTPFETTTVVDSTTKDKTTVEVKIKDPSGTAIVLSARASPFSSSLLPPVKTDKVLSPESSVSLSALKVSVEQHQEGIGHSFSRTNLTGQPLKRIAVLTSGGDSAGMNAAFRAIVRTAIYRQCHIFAIHEGYQGMVDGGDNNIKLVSWQEVAGVLSEGGTVIGTARCKEFRTREGRLKAVFNLVSRGIDAIIVIGGDGSLTGADILRQEWPGLLKDLVSAGTITAKKAAEHPVFAVVGLVGSIDNDMNGTTITIGANTALHRAIEAIDSLASTAASHQRCFVVEIMGRNCGWLALHAALASGADWLLIPEAPSKLDDWETEMCQSLLRHKSEGKRKLMVIVSEGAVDKNGKPIKSEAVRQVIEERIKIETRVTILGHVQRGGSPSAFDRIAPTLQGIDAVEAVLEMRADTVAPMIGMDGNKVVRKPLMKCVEETQSVGKAMADKDFVKAKQLRGPEFIEAVKTFKQTASATPISKPEGTSGDIRIMVVHVGAPAGGVNAATRTIVRLGIARGYTVLGVHNSFEGLATGDVEELNWSQVDNWSMKGGSELGTNRSTPGFDLGMIAFNMQKFNVHSLVIIGGFEGFMSARELMDNRDKYPQFCIPIAVIPATISNNVPGTELSLGADTAVNIIIDAIDELKQSASSSKRRVFVVETMGGHCGFLATFASLGGGATRCYIPEDGISFEDLAEDLDQLKKKFRDFRGIGRVIIRCENSSPTYTVDFIASLLNEEGKKCGLFDAKTCHLGHLQQGGTPSPMDRSRGVRLATSCLNYLQEQLKLSNKNELAEDLHMRHAGLKVYTDTPASVSVVGYIGEEIQIHTVKELIPQTDMKNRRSKVVWWNSVTPLLRILTGYD